MGDTINMDRLMRVIQGLMAKTTGAGATEGEAAAAAEKIQQLLEEYNLDLDQIATSKTDTRKKETHKASAMYKYQRSLMDTVAEMNFCMLWVQEERAFTFGKNRTVKRFVLLGRRANVVATTILYDYLVATMDRLLPYTGMEKRGKSALLWLEGASDRLQERMKEARRERMRAEAKRKEEEATRAQHPGAAPAANALMIVDLLSNEYDLNVDALEGLEPGTTTARRLAREAEAAARRMERDLKVAEMLAMLLAQGESADDAWYHARGMTTPAEDRAAMEERLSKVKDKPETEAQRKKREQRAANYEYEQAKRWEKQYGRRQTAEYQAGSARANDINLNHQVDHKPTRRI